MPAAAPREEQAAGLSARVALPDGTALPGARLWIKHYNGPRNSDDNASSLAFSPGGGMVFVTGTSARAGAAVGRGYFATIAYRTGTGTRLWASRYNGPGHSFDHASSVAVGPRGGRVFVTGSSSPEIGGLGDYATVAYNAVTGARLWAKRYSGPGNGDDGASSVAAGPRGGRVFVTGGSAGDYATVAYDAATGARLWAQRYSGPGTGDNAAFSVAGGPRGGRVFVTGTSANDYATVAYNAATGARLWATRYDGPGDFRESGGGTSVAVSPGGKAVFVTGTSFGASSPADYGTIAYDAATGAQLWATHYNGPDNSEDRAASLAVGPGGGRVFVTGFGNGDYATVAYDATGAQLWATRYNGPGNYAGNATWVVVSPAEGRVFVTGASTGAPPAIKRDDYATVAYNAATGAQLWARRYNGPGNGDDGGSSVAVSLRGGTVIVTGSSTGTTTNRDYTTIAYSS
jgi:hypothetical protein